MEPMLEKARGLHKRAGEVAGRELDWMERWKAAGEPVLVGSARFDLMQTPNLDFEVYAEIPCVQTGFRIIGEIATIPGVKQVQYLNFMDTPDPGFYWRIDYEDAQGVTWDIDNWLVPYAHPHAGMANRFAEAMERALTDETRLAILEIKTAADPASKPRGIDIYRAVLRDGVRSVEAFQIWLAQNPPSDRIETWTP